MSDYAKQMHGGKHPKPRVYTYEQLTDKYCELAFKASENIILLSDLKLAAYDLSVAVRDNNKTAIFEQNNRIQELLNRVK